MKITALTPIRHGRKDGTVEEVAEGESLDVDKKEAERLIASGAAVAGGAQAAKKAADNSDAEAEAEAKRIAEANKKAEEDAEAARNEALGKGAGS